MSTLHVITERPDFTSAQLNKIKKLSVGFAAQIKWHVLCHNRVVDRHYINLLEGLWSSFKDKAKEQCKALEMQLLKHFCEVEVNGIFDRDWRKALAKQIGDNDSIIVIRGDETHPVSSPLSLFIGSTKHNVFVLGERSWGKSVKLVGALDPFHEDDPDKLSDKMVFHHVMQLKNKFKSSEWHVIHAIFVPPLAIKYKSEIVSIHRQETMAFCRQLRCPSENVKFLEGLPESALLAHTAKQQTDLLIVGSRSHGIWDNWLTGSTIEGLMKESELDIMIARRR